MKLDGLASPIVPFFENVIFLLLTKHLSHIMEDEGKFFYDSEMDFFGEESPIHIDTN